MTSYEKELLYLIRSYDGQKRAIETAAKTILEFSEQDESSQELPAAYSRESA